MRRHRLDPLCRAALTGAAAMLAACATVTQSPTAIPLDPAAANVPGACSEAAAGRQDKTGCYLTAIQQVGQIIDGPLFWHVYTYADRASAEAASGKRSVVVEAFGRVWLYSLEKRDWNPVGGSRMAVVGPLETKPGVIYTARYMEATFPPGLATGVHVHSGPEAWYVISGAQCLQTPERTIRVFAGEGALVPEGPPMVLSSIGSETRRSVLLVLHDATKPWAMPQSGWQPPSPCG